MLNLQIDDLELEQNIRQEYGDNKKLIINGFAQFVKQQRIKHDISISKKQVLNGETIEINKVFDDIFVKYE